MKKIGEEATTKPIELRCPSWCRMFKKRDRIVPFDVSPIVPSPEQEVLTLDPHVAFCFAVCLSVGLLLHEGCVDGCVAAHARCYSCPLRLLQPWR